MFVTPAAESLCTGGEQRVIHIKLPSGVQKGYTVFYCHKPPLLSAWGECIILDVLAFIWFFFLEQSYCKLLNPAVVMEEGISACVLFFITSDSFIKRFLSQVELLLISIDFWEIFSSLSSSFGSPCYNLLTGKQVKTFTIGISGWLSSHSVFAACGARNVGRCWLGCFCQSYASICWLKAIQQGLWYCSRMAGCAFCGFTLKACMQC